MYEINPHPYHSLQKTRSALARLDNIIRLLKCTSVDADSPVVTRFDSRATPRQIAAPVLTHRATSLQNGYLVSDVDQTSSLYTHPSNVRGDLPTSSDSLVRWPYGNPPMHSASPHEQEVMVQPGIHQPRTECRCQEVCLGHNVPESKTHTPLWHYTPSWSGEHEPGEIPREETRRIVWAFITLASSSAGHTATLGTSKSTDIFWSASAENVSDHADAICFSC